MVAVALRRRRPRGISQRAHAGASALGPDHPEVGEDPRPRADARARHPGLSTARLGSADPRPRHHGRDGARPDSTRPSYFEEHVSQTYQIGCHLDGLGHLGIDGRYYNGLHYKDIYEPTGLKELGIENAQPWLARGVCLDIAKLEGVDMLEEGFAITPDHIEMACRRQEVDIRAGDVVLFHTGWSALWKVDNERYGALEPGLGWDAGHYLTDRNISLAGADNWCLEVWPPEDPTSLLCVHQHLLAETGTYILENIKTKELVDGGHSEFLFVLTPNRTKGSTGSMAAPLAVL